MLERGYSYAGCKRNAYGVPYRLVEIKQHSRETQKLCSTGLIRPNRRALSGGRATVAAYGKLLMSAPIPRLAQLLGGVAWRGAALCHC